MDYYTRTPIERVSEELSSLTYRDMLTLASRLAMSLDGVLAGLPDETKIDEVVMADALDGIRDSIEDEVANAIEALKASGARP